MIGISKLLSGIGGTASKFGKTAWTNRGWVLGSAAAGIAGSAAMDSFQSRQKNYLGLDEYTSRYKGLGDNASAVPLIYGGIASVGAMFGKTPASMATKLINTFRRGAGPKYTLGGMAGFAGLAALQYGAVSNIGVVAGVGAAGVAGLAYKVAGKTFGYAGATATSGAFIGMGALAMRSPQYAAGEGTITDFREGNNVGRKMDFNTAGLVQALHHNRKM